MDTSHLTIVRRIDLEDGNVLEVAMSPGFEDRVRQYYTISVDQPLEDSHVRTYIYEACSGAVNKAASERELRNAESAERVPRAGH